MSSFYRPIERLHIKLANRIGLTVFAIALVVCAASFFYVKAQTTHTAKQLISQLQGTVAKTAAIASYLDDEQLAQELLDGLLSNQVIAGATVSTKAGLTVHREQASSHFGEALVFDLHNPFNNQELTGQLILYPNLEVIEQKAVDIALTQALIILLLCVATALVVSLLAHRLLTQRLAVLSDAVLAIDPSAPTELNMAVNERGDEIDSLVVVFNELLRVINHAIVTERALIDKTTALERTFRLIFEQASAGICLVGNDNKLMVSNPAFHSLILSQDRSLTLPEFFENSDKISEFLDIIREQSQSEPIAIDLKLKSRAPHYGQKWLHCLLSKVEDHEHDNVLIEVLLYDVTTRTEREHRARFEADHDQLTHLYNRRAGERLISERLQQNRAMGNFSVLMMVDLDHFKPVNDRFGHDAGDIVLREVAKRMLNQFRQHDVCIRWGGDEFVILLHYEQEPTRLEVRAQALIDSLCSPIAISAQEQCQIGASVGMVVAPLHGTAVGELLAKADLCLYQVKKQGRLGYRLYDPHLSQTA